MYFAIVFNLMFSAWAKEETEFEDELMTKITDQAKKIKSTKFQESDNLSEKLFELRTITSTYLNDLDSYCRRGRKKVADAAGRKRPKMSKAERKECFSKLKQVYADLIQTVYFVQKKNLEKTHEAELTKLTELKKASLIDLEKAYQRYLK